MNRDTDMNKYIFWNMILRKTIKLVLADAAKHEKQLALRSNSALTGHLPAGVRSLDCEFRSDNAIMNFV